MKQHTLNDFSKDAGLDMSARYQPINTATIVSQFETAGYTLASIKAGAVRNIERQGFQKHLLTFRHPDLQLRGVNDAIPQVLLKNAYDGTAKYELMLGIYRMICTNGMIVGATYYSASIKHVGQNVLERAVAAAQDVSKQVTVISEKIVAMNGLQLNNFQQLELAGLAADLIQPDSAINRDASALLQARRVADTGNSLWHVFNRVQENIMRGGLSYRTVDGLGRVRNNTARGINAVNRSVNVNKQLWDIAETFLGKAA